jgi:hypothetical protein
MSLHKMQHGLEDIADVKSFRNILALTSEHRLVADHKSRISHEILNQF